MSEGTRNTPIPRDTLAAILESATLAPSSHNTQPWRFELGQTGISLFADRLRALPVNDPDDRELTISCGCALFNLRIAAAHAGFNTECQLLPDPGDEDLLATVSFSPVSGEEVRQTELFRAIARRRTYRKRFEPKQVPSEVLGILEESAETEGAWFRFWNRSMRVIRWPSWWRRATLPNGPTRVGDGSWLPGCIPAARETV